MKNPVVWLLALLLTVLIGGGAGFWYWQAQSQVNTATAKPKSEPLDERVYKYVSLDKVIVMLRTASPNSTTSYLAMDVVFKVEDKNAKTLKDHLPLLRSIAVRYLSKLDREQASALTIDQLTVALNKAFTEAYQQDRQAKPFIDAMIGKLIIE